MSDHRNYYHSSSRTSSRRDDDNGRREERLPPLHNVVGHAYGTTSSTYPYQEINHPLPPVSQHPSYDHHDRSSRGPRLPPIYSGSPSGDGTYSSYSSSARSSTRHYSGNAPASGSSRLSADYPLDAGHSFQAFYAGSGDFIPVTSSSIRPQGTVRSCDIPDENDDPRKRHKCPECGRKFDRPSSLETHLHRHTGNKPFACPASDCDKTFGVKSNMMRHYREQHGGQMEDDHGSTRQPPYSSTSRGSSEQSTSSATFYSSSRRR